MFEELKKYNVSDKLIYDIVDDSNYAGRDSSFIPRVGNIFYFKILKNSIVVKSGKSITTIRETKEFTDEDEFIDMISKLVLKPSLHTALYQIHKYEYQINNIKKLYGIEDENKEQECDCERGKECECEECDNENKETSFRKTFNELLIIIMYCLIFFVPFKFLIGLNVPSSVGYGIIVGFIFSILNAIYRKVNNIK